MSYSSRRENHDLLFSNRATNDPTTTRANTTSAPPPLSAPAAGAGAAAAAASTTRPIHDQYGLSEDEGSDPLQLEHVLGYSGLYRHTMMTVPIDDHTFIKSMGSVISIESMNDPQRQQFLRGHDMAISCLAVSPSGQLIASSQEGTMHYKGMAAPIFIWEVQTGRRLMVLRGLVQRTNLIAFSPDEVFLCGCDEDGLLYIYDLTTGEVIYGQKLLHPISVLLWTSQTIKVGHNMTYELIYGIESNLYQGKLIYDSMRMQWNMTQKIFQLPPSGGLIRTMLTIAQSSLNVDNGLFIYVGTTSGEMMVYRKDTTVFRACIPVCTNGLQDIVVCHQDGSILCGGGDGIIVKLQGRDMAWQKIREIRLDGGIRSLSLSTNELEVLISSSTGVIHRMLCSDFTHHPLTISNNSTITTIATCPYHINYFVTGTSNGEIRLWDLSDYDCLSIFKQNNKTSGSVLCLQMISNDRILAGWQDGSLTCSSFQGQLLWFIPIAHRDGTTTLHAYLGSGSDMNTTTNANNTSSLQYIVTGGMDGAIRIWKLSNRELITQYTEHRKGVSKVLIDQQSPNIVHSVGKDCSVLSYDLKANRRLVCHIMTTGLMTSMTQRLQREYELITCDSLGRLLYWDIDYRDPVYMIQDPNHSLIHICTISPSGRYIAFAGNDQVVKVLDELTHRVIALGQSHCAEILSLAWTSDEKQVISGGADTCLSIWNFYLGGEEPTTSNDNNNYTTSNNSRK